MFYLKNLQVAQGILFLVDNTGQCPTDQSFREFTDAAIAQHLMRQSYYYQHHGKTGAGNRRKGTAKWVRSNFKFLWTNIKPESGHMKHGDLADALFRAKSQVLTEDALQHYGYDSKSFQESELPGFVSDDGNTPPSREQTQTSAISAPRTSQVNFPGSTLKRRSESPDELSLSDHAAKRPRIEDPVVLADAESSPLDMPRCRPCVQSNEDCDRQQPCGRCTSAGISLADCTSGDSAARKDDMIMPESNIGNYRRDAEANISSSLSAQAMPLPPPPPSIGEKRGLEEADDPQQHAAKRPRPGTGDADAEIHITTSHKSWSKLVDDQTEPDDASASLGKRKRETGDTGVNTNLTDDDAMRGPHPSKASKRQATEPSVELGKDDDQLQLTMPVLPEQTDSLLTSNVTSATPKVTFHQEDLDDMPSTTHESRDKDATQPQANGLRVNKQGGFSRLLLKFPITPIQRRMSDLQRELEETVEKLFVHIGRIHEFPCPLIEDPDDELEALYVRCWGVQWRTIFHECVNNNSFQASAVIASLISGFLLDNVLTQRGPLESLAREVRKMLEASGTYGQDLLARINLHQQGKFHPQIFSSHMALTLSSARSYQGSTRFRSPGSSCHARTR